MNRGGGFGQVCESLPASASSLSGSPESKRYRAELNASHQTHPTHHLTSIPRKRKRKEKGKEGGLEVGVVVKGLVGILERGLFG